MVLMLLLWILDAHPIRWPTGDSETEGAPLTLEVQSDVVVVVASDEIVLSAHTGRFEDVDWSWVWVDSFESEIGPVRVCEAGQLRRVDLDDVRVVILTASTATHSIAATAVDRLESFARSGGIVVVERPRGPMREAFSADGRGGLRAARRITYVEDDVELEALQEVPLYTQFIGSTAPLEEATTLLAMDGAPVVYRVRRGDGAVITVDFNYGLAIVSLQQGRPAGEEFVVEPQQPELGPAVSDLVVDESMLTLETPVADLFEHTIAGLILNDSLVPRLWPYPEGRDGVVLLSHEVTDRPGAALWFADYEREQGAASTFFLSFAATPNEAAAERYRESAAPAALWWDHGAGDQLASRPIGFAGIEPLYRRASLVDHRDRVNRSLNAGSGAEAGVRGVRTIDGAWGDRYAGLFRVVANAGLDYDSSYGVSHDREMQLAAYRHGTGRPFRVHDHNGLPFDLLEVPILAPTLATSAQADRFEQLLRLSRRSHHQALGVNVSAGLFEEPGALVTFDSWQWLIELATQHRHTAMSIEEYLDFLRGRADSALRSEVRDGGPGGGLILSVEITAAREDLWIRLEPEAGGHSLHRVTRMPDDVDISDQSREITLFDRSFVLFPVPSEDSSLVVEYR
jgi:hypothetical protein